MVASSASATAMVAWPAPVIRTVAGSARQSFGPILTGAGDHDLLHIDRASDGEGAAAGAGYVERLRLDLVEVDLRSPGDFETQIVGSDRSTLHLGGPGDRQRLQRGDGEVIDEGGRIHTMRVVLRVDRDDEGAVPHLLS